MKRRLFQIGGFIGANLFFLAPLTKGICLPIMNCSFCPLAGTSCPLGVIQQFAIVRRIPFYLLGTLGVIGMTVGSMSCGWLCPIGLLQDWLYRVRLPKLKIPSFMNYSRFLVLFTLVLFIPYLFRTTLFCRLCPVGSLEVLVPFSIFEQDLLKLTVWFFFSGLYLKITLLLIFLLLPLFLNRAFCRFCPLGAILGLFNSSSFYQLTVDLEKCTACNRCSTVCPMGLKPHEEPRSPNCIRCLTCTTECEHLSFRNRFT